MSAIALPTNTPKSSQKKSSTKDKGKGKQKTQTLSNTYVDDTDDEEQTDTAAALVPPGAVPLSDLLNAKEFDYDELKDNDDLELCIIRLPDGVRRYTHTLPISVLKLWKSQVKPKNLDNLKLTLPPSASTSSMRVGTLSKKNAAYDIWSVRDEASDETTVAGGDEVLGLSCLVPRKNKGGKLFTGAYTFLALLSSSLIKMFHAHECVQLLFIYTQLRNLLSTTSSFPLNPSSPPHRFPLHQTLMPISTKVPHAISTQSTY